MSDDLDAHTLDRRDYQSKAALDKLRTDVHAFLRDPAKTHRLRPVTRAALEEACTFLKADSDHVVHVNRPAATRDDASIETYQAGNPATGERWITTQVRDCFLNVRLRKSRPVEHPGWATKEEVRAFQEEVVAEALAIPDFATRLDWAYRYRSTVPEAARMVAEHESTA